MRLKRAIQLVMLLGFIGVLSIPSADTSKVVALSHHMGEQSSPFTTFAPNLTGRVVSQLRNGAHSTDRAGHSTSSMRVVVDGAKTPERISDATAFRHFFTTTLISANPTDEQLKRQRLRLAPLGLEDLDTRAYLFAAQIAREALDQIATERATWTGPDTASGRAMLRRLRQQESEVFQQARLRLSTTLSSEGATRLEAHIQTRVRSKIRILG